MRDQPPPSCVVVGIDGSRSAVDAALWAADEAVGRDLPLRLVYAIDAAETVEDRSRRLADAESAVRYAFTVVEATDKPVKLEAEIVQGRPRTVLVEASRSAVMLCLGAVGITHSRRDPIGSTAVATAASAHCPVAVVRGHDPQSTAKGWVVAEIDRPTTADTVLSNALDEARLRGTPLRVVTVWQSGYTDIHDNHAVADRSKLARAQLDRRLAKWRRKYPDVDMHAVAVHGNSLAYLTRNADMIQLLVVGRERADGIRELVGPPGFAALHHANCSVLICQPQNAL